LTAGPLSAKYIDTLVRRGDGVVAHKQLDL
jgi:hypothetical protein